MSADDDWGKERGVISERGIVRERDPARGRTENIQCVYIK